MSEEHPPACGDGGFAIDSPAFSNDKWRMENFKVQRCPRARPHDWTLCPFAHPGEKAKRRDPRKYRYSGTACPDFRKTGTCRRADACPFSHGVFECWLHPTRYKTQMCTDGSNCRRRVCFFAHAEGELRKPEEYPPLPPVELPADLGAELQLQAAQQQQQAQLAALGGLLGAGSAAGADRAGAGLPVPALSLDPLTRRAQLLKTLSLGVQGSASLADSSAPTTPISTAVSDLSAQAAMLTQLSGGLSGGCLQSQRNSDVSVLSMRSTGSPNEGESSPRAGAHVELATEAPMPTLTPGATAGGAAGDEATQLLLLLQQQRQQQQQQQQQQQAAAAQVAQVAAAQQALASLPLGGTTAAGGLDPALLLALQSLSLGAAATTSGMSQLLEASVLLQQQRQQQQLEASAILQRQQEHAAAAASVAVEAAALGRRQSLDGTNASLSRQVSGASMQAAAAALLGQALPDVLLSASTAGRGERGTPPLPPSTLPVHEPADPDVHLAVRSPEQTAPDDARRPPFARSMSFDHILAELPRSQSQVHLFHQQ